MKKLTIVCVACVIIITTCMFLDPSLDQFQIMHGLDENECMSIVNILLFLLFSSSSSYRIANVIGYG